MGLLTSKPKPGGIVVAFYPVPIPQDTAPIYRPKQKAIKREDGTSYTLALEPGVPFLLSPDEAAAFGDQLGQQSMRTLEISEQHRREALEQFADKHREAEIKKLRSAIVRLKLAMADSGSFRQSEIDDLVAGTALATV